MIIFSEIKKLIQFGTVGGLMIVINIGILFILTNILGIYYIISAVISYQVLLIISFILNDKWTFKSVENYKVVRKLNRLGLYYVISLAGMFLNIAILYILTEYAEIYYLVSSIVATCIVFLWNYTINNTITWGERSAH